MGGNFKFWCLLFTPSVPNYISCHRIINSTANLRTQYIYLLNDTLLYSLTLVHWTCIVRHWGKVVVVLNTFKNQLLHCTSLCGKYGLFLMKELFCSLIQYTRHIHVYNIICVVVLTDETIIFQNNVPMAQMTQPYTLQVCLNTYLWRINITGCRSENNIE